MKIKLKYAGLISEITNKTSEEIEINNDATLFSILKNLASKYGPCFKRQIFNPEKSEKAPDIIILLNGINVHSDFDKKLTDEDFVSIIPLVSGG